MHYAVRIVSCIMISVSTSSLLHGADHEAKQAATDQTQNQAQVIDATALLQTIQDLKAELATLTKRHSALTQIVMTMSAEVNILKAHTPQNQGQVYVAVYQAMPMPGAAYQQPNSEYNAALCAKQSEQSQYRAQAYVRSYQHSGKTPAPVLTQSAQE